MTPTLADIGLMSGHVLLADWLFVFAAILSVIEAVAIVVNRPAIGRGVLVAAGLALVALGWLVL